MLQICLVSRNVKLRELLREAVGQSLTVSAPGEKCPEADLYVWDRGNCVAATRTRPCFALAEASICSWQSAGILPNSAANFKANLVAFSLKPVNRATLEAFLDATSVKNMRKKLHRVPSKSTEAIVSERNSLLRYVLETNLKLQEYDQDRTNFLARAIHDLRAPLTALHGYSGLLLDGELGPINSKQADLLRRMRSSTDRMATLARSLLALSVDGHVQRNLQLEQGDLEACVSQALEDLSTSLDEKQISVDAQFDPPEQPILCDPQQIAQVFLNLLENACKFTPKRGSITVRGYSLCWDPEAPGLDDSAAMPNAYRVDVQDSGPGVDPALSDRIF